MNSYSDVDGVPAGADPWLLTDLLRDEWGFDGHGRLRLLGGAVPGHHAPRRRGHRRGRRAGARGRHRRRAARHPRLRRRTGRAGAPRRAAPRRSSTGPPARAAHPEGASSACSTPDWTPEGSVARRGRRRPRLAGQPGARPRDGRALDRPARRRHGAAAARRGATGAAPGGRGRAVRRRPAHVHGLLRVPQPRAAAPPRARPRHRGADGRRRAAGRAAGRRDGPRAGLRGAWATTASGFAAAVAAARDADLCVAFVGDLAGLFGHGTSGEGCDAEDLRLPGVQADLVEELLATGTPVVRGRRLGPPVRARRRCTAGPPGWCRRSCPARRAGRRSPGCSPAGVQPGGKLPVQIPRRAGRAAGHLPAAAARRRRERRHQHLDSDARCSRSGTAPPTPPSSSSDLRDQRRRDADRRRVHRLGPVPQHRRRGRATRSSSSTCTTSVAQVARPVRAADRLRPGPPRSRCDGRGLRSGVHADRTAFTGRDLRRGSSSRARSRCSSAPRRPTCPAAVAVRLTGAARDRRPRPAAGSRRCES